ncbi:MAG: pilus assembly PilX N-terminal domain-containing protein [Phycisphaerae bacterium]
MATGLMHQRGARRGSALFVAMIFAAIFTCMAVALAVVSESNLAICRNRLDVQQASNLVETGLLLVQREMGGLEVSGSDATALHADLADHFRTAWADAAMLDASQITSDAGGVVFPPISVLGPDGRTGTIDLTIVADGGVEDASCVTVTATGQYGGAVRKAYYDFHVGSGYQLLRDFGVASRSPITLGGDAVIDGANNDKEGSLFSCSEAQSRAIELTDLSQITGNAAVSADGCEVYKGPSATIGGEIQNDAPEHPWPEIDTAQFEQYVETVYDGDGDEQDATYVNVRIPPGTNPTFNGNTQLYGVVYIESPNTVTFNDTASVCGIVVCEEPAVENFADNQIHFNGTLTASGVEYLPGDSRFDGLRDKQGAFLLAPGYAATFAGNFSTVNGFVAAGRLDFTTTASGTVRGNVLNLSDSALTLQGDAHVTIDKSNATEQPAGIVPRYALLCISGSYRE